MSIVPMKELKPAYGFDDVAIVPGTVTVNPELTDVRFALADHVFELPILAAALDAIVDPGFAIAFGKMGGLAVLNLEGLYTRYEDPYAAIAEIVSASQEESAAVIQRLYSAPIREDLVGERVRQIKAGGAVCAVAATPANTKRLAPLAVEAGADTLVAPASTARGAVSRLMPPSTSSSAAAPSRSSRARARAVLGSVEGTSGWPPKPGFTVMTSSRSRSP